MKVNNEIEELNSLLRGRWVSGLWNLDHAERQSDPQTRVKPHLWKWFEIYDSLLQARENISVASGSVEGRVIRLVNPGMPESEMTSHTMLLSFQLIQPGEVAPAHRHTMTAIRFILQGQGAYTNVDGQKMIMEDGDLILTPQWAWHEHAHEGNEPMVWIDGLDVPFIQSLQAISFQPYGKGRCRPRRKLRRQRIMALLAPSPVLARTTCRFCTIDGRTFIHPSNGWPMGAATLTTALRWNTSILRPEGRLYPLFRARPGESTKGHRHNSTSIYHAFRGRGTTMINGELSHWEKGDTFIVPLWSWHEHANRASQEEAILFSMHDLPILKAFGLHREEAQA